MGVGTYHGKSPTPAKGAPDKIQKTMHEFKHGQLKSGGGGKVKSRKQAIAIALSQQRKANRGRRTKRASRRR